jgi:hypothetical protein
MQNHLPPRLEQLWLAASGTDTDGFAGGEAVELNRIEEVTSMVKFF